MSDDDEYITQLKALCVEYGFNPTAAYEYRSAKATLAQVRADLEYKKRLADEGYATLTPEAKARTDARIAASKQEQAATEAYFRTKREAAQQQTKH
jgi:hypothetical protein